MLSCRERRLLLYKEAGRHSSYVNEEKLFGKYANCIVESFHRNRAFIRVKLQMTDEFSGETAVQTHIVKACQVLKYCVNCKKPGKSSACQLSLYGYCFRNLLEIATIPDLIHISWAYTRWRSQKILFRNKKSKKFWIVSAIQRQAFMFRHLPWAPFSVWIKLNSSRF